jgi:hypothetical protein
MAKSAFAIDSPATLILVTAGVVSLGHYLLSKRNAGPKEIPSSAIPPAHLPGGGLGDAQQLGSPVNLGRVDLSVLYDPKIVVLRPGGSVELWTGFDPPTDVRPWRWGDDNQIVLEGVWTGPRRGREAFSHQLEWQVPVTSYDDPFGADHDFGLFNVGGPSQGKLERTVEQWGIGRAPVLLIRASSSWGPNDWAQLRLYRADVAVSGRRGTSLKGHFVEETRIRTDLPPAQTVWIMGAR